MAKQNWGCYSFGLRKNFARLIPNFYSNNNQKDIEQSGNRSKMKIVSGSNHMLGVSVGLNFPEKCI